MAIDEALLELHLRGKTAPTLRFYGWTPAAVSIGYSQKISPETVKRIKEKGYSVVRRPTGGRAVLHEGELTYCFIASSEGDEPARGPVMLAPSVNRAYKQICQALTAGLSRLGVETALGKSDSPYKSLEDCFDATTTADLHYQGKKIVGSAQLRRKHGVLQHGSIMLDQKQDAMAQILGLNRDSELVRHANLYELAKVERLDVEEAIGSGFTDVFNCRFAVYDLSAEEWEVVDSLKSDKARYSV